MRGPVDVLGAHEGISDYKPQHMTPTQSQQQHAGLWRGKIRLGRDEFIAFVLDLAIRIFRQTVVNRHKRRSVC